jgi:drug/metabolite transporter (DMT)-like permease
MYKGQGLRRPFLALGGTLSVAFATVYTRRNLQGTDVVVLTAGQMAVGLLAVLPLALLLSDPRWAAISWRSWLAVTYSAVVGSFVAFLIFFYLVRTYGATTASLPTYVIPAVSGGLGALLLGEVIGSSLVAGAGLTLLGVFLSSRA